MTVDGRGWERYCTWTEREGSHCRGEDERKRSFGAKGISGLHRDGCVWGPSILLNVGEVVGGGKKVTYSVGRGDLHPLVVPWASTELEIGMDMGPENPCRPTLLAQLRKHCPCRTRPLSNPRFFNVEMPRTRRRWGRHFFKFLHWLGELSMLCDAILQRAWQF